MNPGARCLAALSLLLLAGGCGGTGGTVRSQEHLFTFYTQPRAISPGPVVVGVRIQDRDYRILTQLQPRLAILGPGLQGTAQEMSVGPGRDFRARVIFPLAGRYELQVTAVTAKGTTLQAEYALKVSNPR